MSGIPTATATVRTDTKAEEQAETGQVVRVGIYENQPKLFTNDEGEPDGFYIDILHYIAQQENWTIQYVPCVWEQCLAYIENGSLDLMPDVAHSEERDRRFQFNDEPILSSWSVVYARNGINLNSILDLHQKRVAVLTDSIQYSVLKARTQNFDVAPEFVEVTDFEQMFQLLSQGTVDAGVVNRFFGAQAQSRYPSVTATNILVRPSQLHVIASEANEALLTAIDHHLSTIKAEPTSAYYTALNRWLTPVERNSWSYLRYLLLGMAISAVGGGIAAVIVWNRKLASEVQERKKIEAQLRSSEQRFRNAIAQAPFPIIIHAEDGEVLQLSSTWTEITGYSRDDIPTIQTWAKRAYGDRADEILNETISTLYHLQQRSEEGDFIIHTHDGEKRVWQFSSSPLGELADGRKIVISMAADVTDQRKAEQELRNSEAKSRGIINALPDLIFLAGADGVYRDFPAPYREFDYVSRDINIAGRHVTELVPPDIAAQHFHYIQQALKTNDVQIYEQQIQVGDRLQDEEVRVVKTGEDEVLFIIRDISERKRTEAERLQTAKMRSELKLIENLFDTLFAGYWDWDAVAHTEYYSPGFKRMLGYEDHELANVPETWKILIFEEDMPIIMQTFDQHVKSHGEIPYLAEVRYHHKNGSPVWVMCSAQVVEWSEDGQPNRMIGCHIDISDRKQTEQALAASETRLKTLINALPFGVWVRDANDVLILQNSVDRAHYGDQLGTTLEDLNLSADHIKQYYSLKQTHNIGETHSRETSEVVNGKDYSFLRIETLWEDADQGLGMLGVAIDVTELKRAKEALQISEERLRTLVNALPLGIWVRDSNGYLVLQNDEDIARFGEIIGTNLDHKTVPSEWVAIHEAIKQRCFSEGPITYERTEIIHGEPRTFLQIDATLPDLDGGIGTFGVSIDITERKAIENQVQEYAQQLETANKELESFTYSVSHDLRAPLRHISGFITALKLRLKETGSGEDSKITHYLTIIEGSSQKMGALIEGLLTLSRVGRRELAQCPVHLQTIVQRITRSLQHYPLESSHPDADTTQTTPDIIEPVFIVHDLPTVEGDETLLHQAFYNLLDNAVKFSRDRQPPHIEIGVLNEPSDPNKHTIFIRDNGVGFDMAYADQLFGAFQRLHSARDFVGTGIGLAIVQRIIHRHNGEIWAESTPNQGACFYLSLSTAPSSVNGSPQITPDP
jgi:PAS domain S-box-containing protein